MLTIGPSSKNGATSCTLIGMEIFHAARLVRDLPDGLLVCM